LPSTISEYGVPTNLLRWAILDALMKVGRTNKSYVGRMCNRTNRTSSSWFFILACAIDYPQFYMPDVYTRANRHKRWCLHCGGNRGSWNVAMILMAQEVPLITVPGNYPETQVEPTRLNT
jgi:hypothetical protein